MPVDQELCQCMLVHGGEGLRQGTPKLVVGETMSDIDPTARKAALQVVVSTGLPLVKQNIHCGCHRQEGQPGCAQRTSVAAR